MCSSRSVASDTPHKGQPANLCMAGGWRSTASPTTNSAWPHGDRGRQDNALERARNVVEHFDEYYRGTGKQQKQDQADKTFEDLAQDYRIDFEPPADRPQLRVGPVRPAEALFTIDLVTTAPQAARQLVDAVHTAIVQDETPNANG